MKMNRDLAWDSWVGEEKKRAMSFSASPKEVKMKAGLSFSMLFVDFDEHKPVMRWCLQGTISKPRVNPSKLVGSPGMNSGRKLGKSGHATGFRKFISWDFYE